MRSVCVIVRRSPPGSSVVACPRHAPFIDARAFIASRCASVRAAESGGLCAVAIPDANSSAHGQFLQDVHRPSFFVDVPLQSLPNAACRVCSSSRHPAGRRARSAALSRASFFCHQIPARHDRQADQGQCEREQQAVGEHATRQVTEVGGDAQAAEHRKHAAPEHRSQREQRDVDQKVDELASSESDCCIVRPLQNAMVPNRYSQNAKSRPWAIDARARKSIQMATASMPSPNTIEKSR